MAKGLSKPEGARAEPKMERPVPQPPPPPANETTTKGAPVPVAAKVATAPQPIRLILTVASALGNGDRPAGFELGTLTLAPDVTVAEVATAFRNPERLAYR